MKRLLLVLAPATALLLGCSTADPQRADDPSIVVDANEPTQASSGTLDADAATTKKMKDEMKRAGRLLQQARFDEALEVAVAVIAQAPHRVEPYEVLSDWYTQLGRHDLAIDAFERLSAGDAHGFRFQARHQALSKDLDAAMTTLERCVGREPRHAGCRFERALLLLSSGRFEPAVEDLSVAYESDADTVTAARLAAALRVTGRYEQAREIVESALERDPDSTQLLLIRGHLLARDHDDEAAEQTLRRVVELDPTLPEALRSLGELLLRRGQDSEGRYYLSRAGLYRDYNETSRPFKRQFAATRDGTAALIVAELELTVANHTEAQRWLNLARSAGAPAQRLAAAQAWAWYALGDIAKGDAELARAGGPTDGRANLARAARAIRAGNEEQAASWLRRAIEHGPDERSFLRRAAELYVGLGDQSSADRLRARAVTAGFP
jgi:tetratricopeptide (TPR) repeat protein